MLAARRSSMPIQRLTNSSFPCLFSGRVAVHDLLGTELDDFLETHGYNFGVLLRCRKSWAEPV